MIVGFFIGAAATLVLVAVGINYVLRSEGGMRFGPFK